MGAATVEDVARLAHVSRSTVSNFFHHPNRLAPQTSANVLSAVRELGYQPNDAARSLRASRKRRGPHPVDPADLDDHPTLRDVAATAGLSYQTVSRALNHPDLVRPSTLERVLVAVHELRFAPNPDAVALRRGGAG